jgi:predicted metalloendopeptidase
LIFVDTKHLAIIKLLVDLYNNEVEPLTGKNVNGKQTLRENVADSGAIRGAYEAYKAYTKMQSYQATTHVPGYQKYSNDQTFFIGFATVGLF